MRGTSVTAVELGDRLLVVAPHPDDEALAVGGILAQAAARGADVRVAFLTSGDGYRRAAAVLRGRYVPLLCLPLGQLTSDDYRSLGEARACEARTAVSALGLGPGAATFLGYPDGGLTSLEVAGGLSTLVAEFAPTAVLAPHPADTNPDHRAAARLTESALASADSTAARFAYLVHHYTWPWSQGTSVGLRPPRRLLGHGDWKRFDINDGTRVAKAAAIEAHTTQTAVPDLGFFMRSFVRDDEWLEAF